MTPNNVIIGWSISESEEESGSGFQSAMVSMLSSIEGFTDEEHITFMSLLDDITAEVKSGKVDVVICSEEIYGQRIGRGTVRQWMAAKEWIKIILVLGNEKKGTGKVQSLFDVGYFDGLFEEDFKPGAIERLLRVSRTEPDAYDYYGLEDYGDPGDEKNANGERPVEKKSLADNPVMKDETSEKQTLDKTEDIIPRKPEKGKKKENHEGEGSGRKKDADKVIPGKDKKTRRDPNAVPDVSEGLPEKKKKDEQSKREISPEVVAKQESDVSAPEQQVVADHDDGPIRLPEKSSEVIENRLSDTEILSFLESKEQECVKIPKREKKPLTKVERCLEHVLKHYTKDDTTLISNLEHGLVEKDDFTEDLNRFITQTFPGINEDEARAVFDGFYDFMWGSDIIKPLIDDIEVSDIKLYNEDRIMIKRNGVRMDSGLHFRSRDHYNAFVSHFAKRNHVQLSEAAILKLTDTSSSNSARLRVNITTERINADGYPCVQIRRVNNIKYTTRDLIDLKMFSPRTAAFMIRAAQNDSGIVVTGENHAGKTSFLNWLIDYIPHDMSALCMQESNELYTYVHPDILFQVQREGYQLSELTVNGLLTDNDYFIIGEIKGQEAKDFLNAAYTGSRCWTTVHSPSSQDALPRIAHLANYNTKYTEAQLLRMLMSLQVIVFLKNFRVAEISEVIGWDSENNTIRYKRIPLD